MAENCSDLYRFWFFHWVVYQRLCIFKCIWFNESILERRVKARWSGLGFPLNSEWIWGLAKIRQDSGLHLHSLTQTRSEISGLSRMNHAEVPNNITESLTRRSGRGFPIGNAKRTPKKKGSSSHWDNSCGSLAEISLITRPAFLAK